MQLTVQFKLLFDGNRSIIMMVQIFFQVRRKLSAPEGALVRNENLRIPCTDRKEGATVIGTRNYAKGPQLERNPEQYLEWKFLVPDLVSRNALINCCRGQDQKMRRRYLIRPLHTEGHDREAMYD